MNNSEKITTLDYPDFLEFKESNSGGIKSNYGDKTYSSILECCPIDGTPMREIWSHNQQIWGAMYQSMDDTGVWITIQDCPMCGWWQIKVYEKWRSVYSLQGNEGHERNIISASLRKFENISDNALDSLRDYLHSNNEKIRLLHPSKFEKLVASVFKDYFNCEVRHVGKSGDGGIDLLLIENENVSAIQVKRRLHENKVERPTVVRDLVGAMIPFGYNKGKVVTTADKFGPSSHSYTKAIEKDKFKIDLIDCDAFLSILNCVHSESLRPWECALNKSDVKIEFGKFTASGILEKYLKSINIKDSDLRSNDDKRNRNKA